MSVRIGGISVAVLTVLSASLAAGAQQPAQNDADRLLPPGNGQALVAKNCTACHDLEGTSQLRKTREEWDAIVVDMIGRGAPLFIEEVDPIVGYLADAFGPKAPPVVDVNQASKEDLMKLAGITPQVADRVLAYRTANGRFTSLDQVKTTLGISNDAFDKVKWYLRVGR